MYYIDRELIFPVYLEEYISLLLNHEWVSIKNYNLIRWLLDLLIYIYFLPSTYLPTYLSIYIPTYLPTYFPIYSYLFCYLSFIHPLVFPSSYILPFMYSISSHLFLSIFSQHTFPLFAVVIECVLVFHHYPFNMVAALTALGTSSVYMIWYLILIGWIDE